MEQKTQLLSNLIVVPQQRLLLIIDDVGREKNAHRILRQFLSEQGHDETTIKTLPVNDRLRQTSTLARFLSELRAHKNEGLSTVVLPTLADFLCYQRPANVFEFLHELRNCESIQRSIVWASTPHLIFPNVNYLMAACGYLCDAVLHFIDEEKLSFLSRKPSGGVTNKTYTYKVNKNEYLIQIASCTGDRKEKQLQQSPSTNVNTTQTNSEHGSTFKIELEEEELVARNAMKMPYEKIIETGSSVTDGGGNIVYTPDATDDFDEEDPDEDLFI